jgi:hypothetical protein
MSQYGYGQEQVYNPPVASEQQVSAAGKHCAPAPVPQHVCEPGVSQHPFPQQACPTGQHLPFGQHCWPASQQ